MRCTQVVLPLASDCEFELRVIADTSIERSEWKSNVSTDSADWMDDDKRRYNALAGGLVDALLRHLPQGLTDQILAELCARKASVLRPAQDAPIRKGDGDVEMQIS